MLPNTGHEAAAARNRKARTARHLAQIKRLGSRASVPKAAGLPQALSSCKETSDFVFESCRTQTSHGVARWGHGTAGAPHGVAYTNARRDAHAIAEALCTADSIDPNRIY